MKGRYFGFAAHNFTVLVQECSNYSRVDAHVCIINTISV